MQQEANKTTTQPFRVILNKQTPITQEMESPRSWVQQNERFVENFLKFAFTLHNAYAIAANQCSHRGERISDRFFAIRKGDDHKGPFRIIVSPTIVKMHGAPETKLEGCLSWPDKNIQANRYPRISVTYYTMDGDFVEEDLTGLTAQIFQHEYDHLMGVEENVLEPGTPFKRDVPKVGRNEPCPCGSGKKFKRCCL